MSENDTHEPSEDTQPEEYVDPEEEFPGSVDWTREYHLTPKGWVNGTYKYYGKVPGKGVARPSEAVETSRRAESFPNQSSPLPEITGS